jgi:uncharacterized membrane protein YphA (DoxX/SURF4 family)
MRDLQLTIDNTPTIIDRIAPWIPRIGVAILFFGLGASKFTPHGVWVRLFDQIGFGQWFRVATALLQTGGAVLVLIPRVSWIGGAILSCTMLGAVLVQLFILHAVLLAISPAILMVIASAVAAQARGWM